MATSSPDPVSVWEMPFGGQRASQPDSPQIILVKVHHKRVTTAQRRVLVHNVFDNVLPAAHKGSVCHRANSIKLNEITYMGSAFVLWVGRRSFLFIIVQFGFCFLLYD